MLKSVGSSTVDTTSRVKATPLYEGTFAVGKDNKFIPVNKSGKTPKGTLKLSINPFLIQDEERNILLDAGIGELFGGNTTIETILKNLDEQSVAEYEISDIFLSHLHFDHMGGIAHRQNGYWELTFPDAKIWVSKAGWEKLHSKIDDIGEVKRNFFNFVDMKGDIEFLSDEARPIPNVSVRKIGGHTEFHQLFLYENGENRYMMAGDVIGRRIAINRSFLAKFDFDPKHSMKMRKELKKYAYENGHTIMAYHETDHPLFCLCDYHEKKGYTVETCT